MMTFVPVVQLSDNDDAADAGCSQRFDDDGN